MVAGGNINPSTFVFISATDTVSQASGTNSPLAGISQEFSALAPIPGASNLAAASGNLVKVFGPGEICLLNATSSGWTAGATLTSDPNGNGVTAGATDRIGAVAIETLTSAGLGRVQVVPYVTN